MVFLCWRTIPEAICKCYKKLKYKKIRSICERHVFIFIIHIYIYDQPKFNVSPFIPVVIYYFFPNGNQIFFFCSCNRIFSSMIYTMPKIFLAKIHCKMWLRTQMEIRVKKSWINKRTCSLTNGSKDYSPC